MNVIPRILALLLALTFFWGCSPQKPGETGSGMSMDAIADAYVRLVLEMGNHDEAFVDAYYGPEQWREEARGSGSSLDAIDARAGELLAALEAESPPATADELLRLRHSYLSAQLRALRVRKSLIAGKRLSFDEESLALYDAVAPSHPDAQYQAILDELDPLLPGEGSLPSRFAAYRERFVIPETKLDAVFRAAIEACRERTLESVELPEGESFEVEYVTGKSWGAYNWYQGGFHSLIQVNTGVPIYIDRALDLACHEGYPGHHVYNVLLEKNLVRDRGWVEFSVYPLFSPQSLIAEGTANYGVHIAFPQPERVAFEVATLFPLAGLDPTQVDRYYRVLEKVQKLSHAGNEAARRYLDGQFDADQAADYMVRFLLMTPERAARRVRFIDDYRSYVINYNLGQEMVREYIESRAGDDPERRWQEFTALISSPRLPSGLR